jgi:hypothetical protein
MKSIEDQFRDWEGSTFGFGYGSGEEHTIPALKHFLLLCNQGEYGNSYDYQMLEKALTPTVAWLFINILAKVDIIEYGTSPRYAWLTEKGIRLKEFMRTHTDEQLIEMATDRTEDSTPCYPDACNCGEKGYEKGRVCANQFWQDKYAADSKDEASR